MQFFQKLGSLKNFVGKNKVMENVRQLFNLPINDQKKGMMGGTLKPFALPVSDLKAEEAESMTKTYRADGTTWSSSDRDFNSNKKIVALNYYTTAETAAKIIQHEQLWMRNATMMNDFLEVRYGFEELDKFFSDKNCLFFEKTDALKKDLFRDVWHDIGVNLEKIISQCYLTSLSYQTEEEFSREGRLSMWRAYGGNSGVALEFKPDVFKGPSKSEANYRNSFPIDQLFKIFYNQLSDPNKVLRVSPVTYTFLTYEVHLRSLSNCVSDFKDGILEKISDLEKFARDILLSYLIFLKHPAFQEEQEVRFFWHPDFCPPILPDYQSIETIGGIPQKIIKIPLREDVFPGYGLNNLLSHVLIGPTEYPQTLRDSFLEIMCSKGIEDPESRITVTNIPLRPNR